MIEMIFWLSGLYALITGRLGWGARFHLTNWRARLAGLSWMVPLPVTLYTPRMLREWMPASETHFFYGMVEIILIIVFIGGGLLLGWWLEPKRPQANSLVEPRGQLDSDSAGDLN